MTRKRRLLPSSLFALYKLLTLKIELLTNASHKLFTSCPFELYSSSHYLCTFGNSRKRHERETSEGEHPKGTAVSRRNIPPGCLAYNAPFGTCHETYHPYVLPKTHAKCPSVYEVKSRNSTRMYCCT